MTATVIVGIVFIAVHLFDKQFLASQHFVELFWINFRLIEHEYRKKIIQCR